MPGNAGAIKAGRAYVEAYLDGTQFDRDAKNFQGKLNHLAASAAKIGGTLLGIGGSTLAGLGGTIKLFAAAGDQLDKMAKRSGFAVETLSALEFAASQSGASITQFDRALAAMARFAVMAERGLSTATDNLEMLGLEASTLEGLSPEKKFLVLADAISNVQDPTIRAGLALNVFGRQGRELLPLLENGGDGIRQLMDRAKDLGLVLSREDATAAADVTDAMDELTRTTKTLFLAIGRELTPEATRLARSIAESIPAVQQWIRDNREWVVATAKVAAVLTAAGATLLTFALAAKAGAVAIGVLMSAKAALLAQAGLLAPLLAGLGLALIAKDAIAAATGVDELNREIQRSIRLNRELATARKAAFASLLSDVQKLPAEARVEELQNQIARIQNNLPTLEARRAKLQQQFDQHRTVGGAPGGIDRLLPEVTVNDLLGRKPDTTGTPVGDLEATNELIKENQENLKKFTQALEAAKKEMAAAAKAAQQTADAASDQKRGDILGRLRESLATFGLNETEKALRELARLGAGERELAEARRLAAELAQREARAEQRKQREIEARKQREEALRDAELERERAQDEAARRSESIATVFRGLRDDIAEFKVPASQREQFRQLRELARLGASGAQLQQAAALLSRRAALTGAEQDVRGPHRNTGFELGTQAAIDEIIRLTSGREPVAEQTAANTARLVALIEQQNSIEEARLRQERKQETVLIGSPN